METIGRQIKELRKDKGMTQDELARTFKMSRATISGIENGKVAGISIFKIEAILNYFNHTLVATRKNRRPTLNDLKSDTFHD